ncbi:unnamed protein product [Onchocerca flexuosa]|uniref:Uncharacterized protein n=1 Tax=Onchocerca flexuosa TaxID=387005 RepID=A0A3P7U061_9BILA|nr:unnamed protein product [Onchocerca flexuosa]
MNNFLSNCFNHRIVWFLALSFTFLFPSNNVCSHIEQILYKKAIVRAYARKSALLEPTAVQPPNSVLDDDTLKEEPETKEGELTENVCFLVLLNADKFSKKFNISKTIKTTKSELISYQRIN